MTFWEVCFFALFLDETIDIALTFVHKTTTSNKNTASFALI